MNDIFSGLMTEVTDLFPTIGELNCRAYASAYREKHLKELEAIRAAREAALSYAPVGTWYVPAMFMDGSHRTVGKGKARKESRQFRGPDITIGKTEDI